MSFIGDYFDGEYDNPFDPDAEDYYASRRPLRPNERFAPNARPEVKQAALGEINREDDSYFNRFVKGAFNDVADIGKGIGTLTMLPFSQPGRQVLMNAGESLVRDPIGAGKFLLDAVVEPYLPQGGEDWTDVVGKRILDHPLSTLMDAAGALSGVGMAAKGLGVVATAPKLVSAGERIVQMAAELDPVTQALRGGEKLGYSIAPSMMKKRDMRRALADFQEAENLKTEVATRVKNERINDFYGRMTPEERAMFHPYAEGQMSFLPNDPNDPIGFRMGEFAQEYESIHKEWEVALGIDPETQAQQAVQAAWNNGVGKMAPDEARVHLETVHNEALAAAQEQQAIRRTVAGRDVVYDAKRAAWNEAASRTRLENQMAGLADESHWLNPFPDLIDSTSGEVDQLADAFTKLIPADEIRGYMAGQGAVYVPHMREVLSHEQATVGNLLTKAHEAIPTKFNEGAMQRTGMLDQLRPVEKVRRAREALENAAASGDKKAARLAQQALEEAGQPLLHSLLQTNLKVARATETRSVWEAAAEKFATETLEGKALDPTKIMSDVRLVGDPERGIAATHQLMWPNGRHQLYQASSDVEDLLGALQAHFDDPIVKDLNIADQVKRMADRLDKTIAVKRGKAYIVPNELGHVVHEMVTARAPITNEIVNAIDKGTDVWRFTTLNMRPAWVLNNVAGNMIFNAMYGLHPLNPASYKTYFDTFRAWGAKKYGWFGDEGQKLAKVYDLPGIAQGGLYGSEAVGSASRTSQALLGSESRVLRGVGGIGDGIARFNQGVESFFRASAAIYGLKKAQKYEMLNAGKHVLRTIDVGERLDELSKLGGTELLKRPDFQRAFKQTNDALNNYARQSPLQRKVLRQIMPFQSFYRHALTIATKYPFEKAAQATLVRTLAKVVREDLKDQVATWGFDWDHDVPERLRDSIPMGTEQTPDGQTVLRLLNTKGPNPLSILSGVDPGAESLAAMHPVLKVAIETLTGVNLFTREPFKGPHTSFTGKTVDAQGNVVQETVRKNPVENLLQQFWPTQVAEELLAGGRQKYDTTTLLDQLLNDTEAYKKDPVTGTQVRKPFSPARSLLRPVVAPPQTVELPTREQRSSDASVISGELNRVWREASPEERAKIRRLLIQKRTELGAQRPAKVRPHR